MKLQNSTAESTLPNPSLPTGIMDRNALIYRGTPPDTMCVDQYLRILPDGSWGVFFTTGGTTEPAPENYIALSRSMDNGKTWSPMKAVLKYKDGTGVTLTEVYVYGDKITIFASIHGGIFDKWRNSLIESFDNGATWSAPIPFQPLPRRTFVRNLVETSWGEWIFPYQMYETQNDDPETPIWRDGSFKSPKVGALITGDRGKSWIVSPGVAGVDWAENNIIEIAGEKLVMLIRTDGTGCLYRSESTDRGRSWSEPVPTDIPNPGSKFRLYKLKDGRITILHNPNPSKEGAISYLNQPNRNPLSIWISDDDMKTWSYKRDLFNFPGSLSYPDGFVDKEERYIHFAFDYNRHDLIYWGAEIPAKEKP